MKYLTAFLSGLIFVILLSFLVSPFLNDVYIDFYNIQPGPDGESELASFLIFWQWPVFFISGFITGSFLHKKYLTKYSDRTQ